MPPLTICEVLLIVNIDADVLRDSFKAFLTILILTIIYFYLPVFNLIILIVWPIPIVYLGVKHGIKFAIIVIILAAFINSIILGSISALLIVISFGFIGVVIAGSIIEGFSPAKTLILTIVAVFISQLIFLYSSIYVFNFDFYNVLENIFENIYYKLDMGDIEGLIEAQVRIIRTIFPSLLLGSTIITASLTYYISHWYLNNQGIKVETYKSIEYWRFPRILVFIGIILSLIFYRLSLMWNIAIILFFIVFLQGFGVGLYYLSKKNGGLIIKWFYIMAIVFIPPFPFILILVGLIDMCFNLRHLN
jgi:uncharacterized protein YybS (DUF2232 family)